MKNTSPKLKTFALQRKPSRIEKITHKTEENICYLIRDLYPEYIKNSYD